MLIVFWVRLLSRAGSTAPYVFFPAHWELRILILWLIFHPPTLQHLAPVDTLADRLRKRFTPSSPIPSPPARLRIAIMFSRQYASLSTLNSSALLCLPASQHLVVQLLRTEHSDHSRVQPLHHALSYYGTASAMLHTAPLLPSIRNHGIRTPRPPIPGGRWRQAQVRHSALEARSLRLMLGCVIRSRRISDINRQCTAPGQFNALIIGTISLGGPRSRSSR